ncbi:P-type conjugative transfer ATPase TrbB [Stenotrophomonas acidaminiphila]|uniref:P-type conjugative transfer ATPase TrbB n=1 Tax=Stenotrophomonas acidaminiphila TaxID=128780 RepID=UPI0015F8A0CD|nr:P-type conjugative transfer ATPase TrbB [Stenotrophomonas acidaminiphila]
MDGGGAELATQAPGVSVAQQELSRRVKTKLERELGPLVCDLLQDENVIEIMLNPDGKLWVERFGEPMKVVGCMPESQARSLMGTVAATLEVAITAQNPILECELPFDGSRFEALLPPIVQRPTFSIRKKAVRVFSLADYVSSGIMTATQREIIERAVLARKNILVVGGTGSGKTTLTNAIIHSMGEQCPEHRLITIEDTGELQCEVLNVVALRAVEYVTMTQLLRATMRLRPDRIVVGEVRGKEALALLKAWNTGHPGGVATVHANSAPAGLIRMEQLVAEATQAPMYSLISEAVNLIVSIGKVPHVGRRILEVVSVEGHDGNNYLTKPITNTEE